MYIDRKRRKQVHRAEVSCRVQSWQEAQEDLYEFWADQDMSEMNGVCRRVSLSCKSTNSTNSTRRGKNGDSAARCKPRRWYALLWRGLTWWVFLCTDVCGIVAAYWHFAPAGKPTNGKWRQNNMLPAWLDEPFLNLSYSHFTTLQELVRQWEQRCSSIIERHAICLNLLTHSVYLVT